MVTASKRYLAEKPDEERKVVFLDIDGVLQRGIAQDRFNHDLDGLKCKLSKEYNDDTFLGMDKYDVGAVYYDWTKLSVDVLRDLLNDCNAEIVLSSDWRMSKDLTQMRALFKIHKLDKYLTELVPATGRFPNKKVDIKAYLEEHPKLDRYAVIDDLYMGNELYDAFERHRLHIAGATPMIYNGSNGRPLEIRTWLARRPDVKKFVILDDDTFWNWGWLEPFVVTTSCILRHDSSSSRTDKRICGLDEEYAQKAIEILA